MTEPRDSYARMLVLRVIHTIGLEGLACIVRSHLEVSVGVIPKGEPHLAANSVLFVLIQREEGEPPSTYRVYSRDGRELYVLRAVDGKVIYEGELAALSEDERDEAAGATWGMTGLQHKALLCEAVDQGSNALLASVTAAVAADGDTEKYEQLLGVMAHMRGGFVSDEPDHTIQ